MKKFTGFILLPIMLILILASSMLTASAAGDSLATATSISMGKTYYGSITDSNYKDFYKFTLTSSGEININLKAYIYITNYYIYDADGNEIWSCEYQYRNDTSGMYSMDKYIDLTKGTYYFAVVYYNGTGNYNFKINFTSANENFTETFYGDNQNLSEADTISFNTLYKGQIAKNDSRDFYKFTLNSSGEINIVLDACIYITNYYIYDADGNEIWSCEYQYCNDTSGIYSMDKYIDLTKGTYYFAIVHYNGTGNYNFKINFTSANESFTETLYGDNQNLSEADTISLNTLYKGQIAKNDYKDFYKFTLNSSGEINIVLDAYIYISNYYIYDADGNEIWSCEYQYCNDTSGIFAMDKCIDLTKGTYYFAIVHYNGTGNYNLKINFTSAKESFTEVLYGNNQTMSEADTVSIDKTYKGQIAQNDKKDFYKFTITKDTTVKISITAKIYITNYYLYNENGSTVWSKNYVYWNDTSKKSTINETIDLSAGTYYFAVVRYDGTGNYSFSINHTHYIGSKKVTKATLTENGKAEYLCGYCKKVVYTETIYSPKTIKLSATSLTYNAKTRTPVVTVKDSAGNVLTKGTDYTVTYSSGRRNVGTYKVTVKMIGNYTGSKTLSFKIKPMDISKCTVKLSATSLTYNGNTRTPTVTVTNANGAKLTKDTHYTVTYASGRKNAGTYKVTVTMKGNYTGTKTLSFKIKPMDISKCTVKLSATSLTYNGAVRTPTVTVTNANGVKLTKNTHYTVTYASGRKNAGTYKVTVTMKGNYTGTKTLTFKINPIKISTCTVKLSATSLTYNGNVRTPTVTVTNSYGTKLTKDKHYTVTYANGRKNVGTYKVTIKMIGNYTGTKTLTFKINPPKTTVASLKAGTKSITVNLTKKTTQVTGYQIQYSRNKDFTNAKIKTLTSSSTVKTTLSGLTASKTYYVRVRTYKTVNDVKYYSGWSQYKYVKTK